LGKTIGWQWVACN